MNARSNIIGKVFSLFLLAALTLCIRTPVLAVSNTTTLTTAVPTHFDMRVTIVGSGMIEINGRNLLETGVVPIERNQAVTIKITPRNGYHISSVIYDDKDITEAAKSGSFTLPQLEREASFCVKFTANASTPSTGDNSYPAFIFFSVTAILSLLGITILLTTNRKKSVHK